LIWLRTFPFDIAVSESGEQWAVGRVIAAKAFREGFRWLHAGGTTTESYAVVHAIG
jgi:hypothetical protein